MSEVTQRVTAESSPHAHLEPAPRHSSRAVPSLEVSLSMPCRSSADRGDFRREKPTWFPFLSSSNSSKEGNGPQAFFLTCCQTSISVSSLLSLTHQRRGMWPVPPRTWVCLMAAASVSVCPGTPGRSRVTVTVQRETLGFMLQVLTSS